MKGLAEAGGAAVTVGTKVGAFTALIDGWKEFARVAEAGIVFPDSPFIVSVDCD